MPYPELWRDANGCYISAAEGTTGLFSTTGIKVVTTGASTTELDLSGFHAAGNNEKGQCMVRVVNLGTNPALVAFGAATATASYTGNTNMHLMLPNTERTYRLDPAQVSAYHLQVTGANTLQFQLCV